MSIPWENGKCSSPEELIDELKRQAEQGEPIVLVPVDKYGEPNLQARRPVSYLDHQAIAAHRHTPLPALSRSRQ